MTTPVIVWTIVIAVMIIAFAVRAIEKLRMSPKHLKQRHHIIEIGEESEMFYCPGDRIDDRL